MTHEFKQMRELIRRGEVPVGYKRTKVGVIPEEWEVVRIEDCLERVGTPVALDPTTHYTQIGIRSHGKGLFYKEPVSGEEIGNKAVFWIEPDCFILNIVFAWEQAIGKTTEKERGMIGSHRFPMYRPIDNKVDIDYLIYYFLTKRGAEILEAASPGGAGRNRTLGQDRFMRSKIALPSLKEQKKITEVLKAQDDLIDKIERLLKSSEQRKKHLMQQLLTGQIRVKGFCDAWKKTQLGTLFAERSETGHQDLDLLAITAHQGVIPRSQLELKDNSSEDKSKYLRICVGDVGYNTMRMWQGVSAYSNYEGIVSPAYTVLRPKANFNAKYFAYLFKLPEIIFLFYRYSQGLVDDTRNLKYESFKKIQVAYPASIREQNAIVEILETADMEISLLQQQMVQEKQKKKALMQLLLTGIVRV